MKWPIFLVDKQKQISKQSTLCHVVSLEKRKIWKFAFKNVFSVQNTLFFGFLLLPVVWEFILRKCCRELGRTKMDGIGADINGFHKDGLLSNEVGRLKWIVGNTSKISRMISSKNSICQQEHRMVYQLVEEVVQGRDLLVTSRIKISAGKWWFHQTHFSLLIILHF